MTPSTGQPRMQGQYKANSITLHGAVAMGTGVMIGAGIFALTGQIAELAGPWFPLSFIAGAIVTALSAYSYIKMSNAWPSSGGIAMILQKCYGRGAVTAGAALLMALSMVIAESLVARTFATYVLRPFEITGGPLVPILAVAVILFAFLVNIAGNRSVGLFSLVMATLKIGGIALFGIAALWASGFSFAAASETGRDFTATGFVASVALAILAFKGFTTITNSGAELTEPNRNVGRAAHPVRSVGHGRPGRVSASHLQTGHRRAVQRRRQDRPPRRRHPPLATTLVRPTPHRRRRRPARRTAHARASHNPINRALRPPRTTRTTRTHGRSQLPRRRMTRTPDSVHPCT